MHLHCTGLLLCRKTHWPKTYKIVILAAAPTPTWHLRISGVSCAWFILVPIDLWGAINMRLHITCLALVFHKCFFLTSCGWPFLLAMAVNVTMSPERCSCIWRPIHGPRLPGESLWCEQVQVHGTNFEILDLLVMDPNIILGLRENPRW